MTETTTSFTDDGPFPPSALDANGNGRLTDDQRRLWRGMSRGYRKAELSFAVIAIIIGALVTFSAGPAKDATIKPIVGLVCLAIAAILVMRSVTGGDKITVDARAGRVESIDGAITKRLVQSQGRGSSTESFFLDVGGRRFECGNRGYHLAPDAGYVRLFYLPRSHRVVNLLRLPDPPTPALTPASVQTMTQSLAAGMHTHSEVAVAEARAQMAAMATQFTSQMHENAVPPPSDQRDPRPLNVAIIGTWSNAFMTVAFAADGTGTQTLANGRQMTGRWSVDDQGRLHAGLVGHDDVATAWIAGTTLTISVGAMALTFERQAG